MVKFLSHPILYIINAIQCSPQKYEKTLRFFKFLTIPLLRRHIARKNYKKNALAAPASGYIFHQGSGGAADKLKFGLSRMEKNGCAVIAVYNALLHLGIKTDIRHVSKELEDTGAIMYGIFGTSPFAIPDFLKSFGLSTVSCGGDSSRYDELLRFHGVGIMTYWNRPSSLTAHTVMCCVTPSGTVRIYNPNRRSEFSEFPSLGSFIRTAGVIPFCFTAVKK